MAQNIVGLEVRKQESGRYIYVLSLDKLNRQLGAIFLTRNFLYHFPLFLLKTDIIVNSVSEQKLDLIRITKKINTRKCKCTPVQTSLMNIPWIQNSSKGKFVRKLDARSILHRQFNYFRGCNLPQTIFEKVGVLCTSRFPCVVVSIVTTLAVGNFKPQFRSVIKNIYKV